MNFPKVVVLIPLCLMSFTLFGCNLMGQGGQQATATNESVPKHTSTIHYEEATVTATKPGPLPTRTVALPTRTSIPTVVVTATPSLTWTPAPTLSRAEALALVEDLLENNGGCRLPCWWGMTPGKTEWKKAKHFLETFVVRFWSGNDGVIGKDGVAVYSYAVYYERKNGESGFQVGVKGDTISGIVSGDATQHQYSISPLLMEYGIPDEVFINTFAVTNTGDPPPFGIILDYRSQGFWAEYSLTGRLSGGNVIGCPKSMIPRLFLNSPERKWTDDEMFSATFGPPFPNAPALTTLSVQDATGMDLETFYQIYKEPSNQNCLKTPADLWY
jgi:hypothetical protein